jgi:hypothetical protein
VAGESERPSEPERARDKRASERERAITFKSSLLIVSLNLIDFPSHARAHSLSLLIIVFSLRLPLALSIRCFAYVYTHI